MTSDTKSNAAASTPPRPSGLWAGLLGQAVSAGALVGIFALPDAGGHDAAAKALAAALVAVANVWLATRAMQAARNPEPAPPVTLKLYRAEGRP